jgi:hypothetical protein
MSSNFGEPPKSIFDDDEESKASDAELESTPQMVRSSSDNFTPFLRRYAHIWLRCNKLGIDMLS